MTRPHRVTTEWPKNSHQPLTLTCWCDWTWAGPNDRTADAVRREHEGRDRIDRELAAQEKAVRATAANLIDTDAPTRTSLQERLLRLDRRGKPPHELQAEAEFRGVPPGTPSTILDEWTVQWAWAEEVDVPTAIDPLLDRARRDLEANVKAMDETRPRVREVLGAAGPEADESGDGGRFGITSTQQDPSLAYRETR
jgi:hypothetical protein